jgi:GalNAc5-diNAcBac-PP-undecaprenol beta-1,3-glucosyltransferase
LILFEEDRKYAIKEDWMFMMANMKVSKLYIVPVVTISMYDHSERSMRSDNLIIIQKTYLAVDWIINRIELTKSEIDRLQAHKYYFCGIHWYLESERIAAMKSAWQAIAHGGIKTKYVSLFIKSFIGRKFISRFR